MPSLAHGMLAALHCCMNMLRHMCVPGACVAHAPLHQESAQAAAGHAAGDAAGQGVAILRIAPSTSASRIPSETPCIKLLDSRICTREQHLGGKRSYDDACASKSGRGDARRSSFPRPARSAPQLGGDRLLGTNELRRSEPQPLSWGSYRSCPTPTRRPASHPAFWIDAVCPSRSR